jgi:hypothetical protein
LLPKVNPRRFKPLPLPSSVGDFGLVLPELDDDWESDRLRPSSARISSRETFRCGCVYVGCSEGSRISVNFEVIIVVGEEDNMLTSGGVLPEKRPRCDEC